MSTVQFDPENGESFMIPGPHPQSSMKIAGVLRSIEGRDYAVVFCDDEQAPRMCVVANANAQAELNRIFNVKPSK